VKLRGVLSNRNGKGRRLPTNLTRGTPAEAQTFLVWRGPGPGRVARGRDLETRLRELACAEISSRPCTVRLRKSVCSGLGPTIAIYDPKAPTAREIVDGSLNGACPTSSMTAIISLSMPPMVLAISRIGVAETTDAYARAASSR